MSDISASFGCLDELTQVIYQGIYKFVVLSTVSDDKWSVHVGLSGQQGRWWRGVCSEDDIRQQLGSKLSDKLLETCAEKLADLFIQGEMCISDWNTDAGAEIKLTLGPTLAKPMHVALVEMSTDEAAAHATKVFIDIALQAQSRKCRLYPSATDYTAFPPVSDFLGSHSKMSGRIGPQIQVDANDRRTGEASQNMPQSIVETRRKSSGRSDRKLAQATNKPQVKAKTEAKSGTAASSNSSQTQAANIPRRPKGISLANPTKRARKYQALEFGSDDD